MVIEQYLKNYIERTAYRGMMEFEFIALEKIGHTELGLVGRDRATGEKVIFYILDFKPYFFVTADCTIPHDDRIDSVEDLGNGYKKVYLKASEYTPDVRELFPKEKVFEADVPYVWRAKIDMGIKSGFRLKRVQDGNIVSWKDVEGF